MRRPRASWHQAKGQPYDGEIAYVDSQVGRVLSALEQARRGG